MTPTRQTYTLWALLLPLLLQIQLGAAQYTAEQRLKRQDSQASNSRDTHLTNHDDFCLFGPANPGSAVSQSDKDAVSWCTKNGHGTRLIPEGTLQGVTYIKAKNWVQVSGIGDFTKINIKPGDWGGQYDSGEHKPDGAKVLGGSDNKEASSWVTLISPDTFCFRACFGDAAYCPTNFADKGCYVLLSNGVGLSGTFQSCTSDDGSPPAQQGDQAPEWRDCSSSPQSGPAPGHNGNDKPNDQNKPSNPPAASEPSTTWVPVQTCVPCPAGSPTPTQQPGVGATNAPAGEGALPPGTIQQGLTQLGGGMIAAESGSGGGGLILKRDEPTYTSNGQCCHTTWTPTVVGAGAGPTSSSVNGQASGTASGPVAGVSSSSGENGSVSNGGAITHSGAAPSGTGLITNPSGSSHSAGGSQVGGAKPSGSGAIGGGTNGTSGNGTSGNGSESAGFRLEPGTGDIGRAMMALLVAAALAAGGGYAVL